MVAGDVIDLHALARPAQDLLHHVVVRLRPVPRLAQTPAVHDVADEIEVVGLVVLQEIEKILRLASPRAQMDVGDPDAAVLLDVA
ncbi:hypothetical protein D3C71_2050510 [compost metagenome]